MPQLMECKYCFDPITFETAPPPATGKQWATNGGKKESDFECGSNRKGPHQPRQ